MWNDFYGKFLFRTFALLIYRNQLNLHTENKRIYKKKYNKKLITITRKSYITVNADLNLGYKYNINFMNM